jgi:hypothetical protein
VGFRCGSFDDCPPQEGLRPPAVLVLSTSARCRPLSHNTCSVAGRRRVWQIPRRSLLFRSTVRTQDRFMTRESWPRSHTLVISKSSTYGAYSGEYWHDQETTGISRWYRPGQSCQPSGITSIDLSGVDTHVTFASAQDRSYVIKSTDNLHPPNWTIVTQDLDGIGAAIQVINPGTATNSSTRR